MLRSSSSPKTKFLDAAEIERGVAEVADAAKRENLRVALVGGAAMQLLGSERLTVDVDVIADRPPADFVVLRSLTFGGFAMASPTGVPVDVIVRDDEYRQLYDEALRHTHKYTDIPVPVVATPYLIALKLAAGRKKDEQDLLFLLARVTPALYGEARAVVKRTLGEYAARSLDSLEMEARWRRAHDGDE